MSRSSDLFDEAKKYIPGGVNSPVRAFKAVGGQPLFIARGKGSTIVDVDAQEYIDCVMSWGPLILGHGHPAIIEAITSAANDGTSFGAATEREVEMAKLIAELVSGITKVRLVNSGTEATMAAVRLARGATGRNKILKFEGCYHGHGDGFLVKAGSGVLTYGISGSPGVPPAVAAETVVAPFNDLKSVERMFGHYEGQIACVIVEPIAGNMGVVLPNPGFLEGLRDICSEEGALLIFDEVISGFRLGLGGAQQYFNVIPDITTLGKIIGGGLPVGAYGGGADIMDQLAPDGPIYQAGTLSGNPLAVAAGLAALGELKKEGVYEGLNNRSKRLFDGLRDIAEGAKFPICVNSIGSMGTMFFGVKSVSTYEEAIASDTQRFAKFHQEMLSRGIYLPPSQFEAFFLSTAHGDKEIDAILSAAKEAIAAMSCDGP
jgi:glutamate-1-semialdehyde 2,1-aminomutase